MALPDDAASEKGALLEALGARVLRQRPVSIAHPQHFVNVARRLAAEAASCSPANPGASCSEPSGAEEVEATARPGGLKANRAAAVGWVGGESANAERVGSGTFGKGAMAEPGWAEGSGAAAVGWDSACAASAASVGSTWARESEANAGGGDGSGSGSGGAGAVFADQFENLANYRTHLATGAEIWAQVPCCKDAPSCAVPMALHSFSPSSPTCAAGCSGD